MNFEEYLQDKLLQIDNLQDRVIMREIFESVLVPLNRYCDQRFAMLENKVLNEEENSTKYDIFTGIVARDRYDATMMDMIPMKQDDVEEKTINLDEVRESIEEQSDVALFSIFLPIDESSLSAILNQKMTFKATVRTQTQEHTALVYLKRDESYLEMLRALYPVFLANKVEWKTPCAPYLYKFCEVYLQYSDAIAGLDITEIDVDFGQYKDVVNTQMIPLWNIDTLRVNTSGYLEPSVDRAHYEYIIYKEKLGEDEYLVQYTDADLLGQHRVNGDMVISCDSKDIAYWTLLRFHSVREHHFAYPVFSNVSVEHNGKSVRTKSAIESRLKQLGYENAIRLKEVRVGSEKKVLQKPLHVDDKFLREWLPAERKASSENVLTFVFEAKENQPFWMDELINYLITRMQWIYPEYRCLSCQVFEESLT